MPHKFPEDHNAYMREYMRDHRENELPEQRESRLESMRQYQRRRYRKSLKDLGLAIIGKGHRRRWKF